MRKKRLIIWPLAALPLVTSLEGMALAQTAPVTPAPTAPGDLGTPTVPTTTTPTTNPVGPAVPTVGTGTIDTVPQPPLPEQPVLVTSLADARNAAGEQTTPLLLEDALVLALQNSPLRTAALAGEAAARARIGESRSAGGLQISLSGSASLSHNELTGLGSSGSTVGTTSTGGSTSSGVPETFPSTGTVGTSITSGAGTTGAGITASSRALRDTGTTGTGTGTTGTGTTGTGTTGGTSGGNISNFFGGGNGFFTQNEGLTLGATYPLYTGGRVKASVRQAQYAALAQAAQTLQTTSDILLATTNAYLGVLRAGQLLDVTESNLAVARERRRIAGVRYAAGAAARLDVLTADTTLADAIQRRLAAGDSLAQYKATLNSFIGRQPETPLRVEPISTLIPRIPLMIGTAATVAPAGAAVPATGTTPGTDSATATASGAGTSGAGNGDAAITTAGTTPTGVVPGGMGTKVDALGQMSSADLRALTDKSRASLATAEQQVNISQAGVDLAKAQRRPSLGLSLAGLINNPVTAIVSRFGAIFGLNVAQTLIDSGRTKSQIAEAQALLAQSQQNLRNQRINLYNQIEQSLLQFDAAQKSVASTDTAVVSAQEAVRAAQLGYQAGVRTSVDVSDAQNSLLQAQTNAVNARFDAAIAQVSLAAAVGVSTEAGQTAYLRALREEAQRNLATQNAQLTQVSDKKHRRH